MGADRKPQTTVIRTLVYQGGTEWVEDCLKRRNLKERYDCPKGSIIEGFAYPQGPVGELQTWPPPPAPRPSVDELGSYIEGVWDGIEKALADPPSADWRNMFFARLRALLEREL